MDKKYSELLNKHLSITEGERKQQLQHFSQAKEKLQGSRSSRSKRSITSFPHLSQEQRTSIGKMYTLNNILKEASKDLALELRAAAPKEIDLPVSMAQANVHDSRAIEKSLAIIGWTEESIKTQKNRGQKQFFNPKSWGKWDGNPFKPFYLGTSGEKEFEEDIRSLQKNALNAHRQQQDLVRNQARAVGRFRYSSIHPVLKSQYEANAQRIASMLASQDSHIVQRVANYLLSSMGQLNN